MAETTHFQKAIKIYRAYAAIETPVLWLLAVDFSLQLISASFFLLMNFYLDEQHFADFEIADMISYRFMAVMLMAFPLGIYVKGRKLKPFFKVAAYSVPVVTWFLFYAIEQHYTFGIKLGFFAWGLAYSFLQVTALPYMLKYAKEENHSVAIAIFFLTFSVSIILCGLTSYLLHAIFPGEITSGKLLMLFSIGGFMAIYCVHQIKQEEPLGHTTPLRNIGSAYDWPVIMKVLLPTLAMAVGAGFTIPFINLFFLHVHGLDARQFSALGTFSYVLVAIGIIIIPFIKKRFGYSVAITLIQSVSVCFLLSMALTEYISDWSHAGLLAAVFYIFRQPLMNVAGPMTSELTMYYVGERNREMISALNASVWSGSWFISSQIFKWLRYAGWPYVHIFFITVLLYVFAIAWYYSLIRDYQRRQLPSADA